MNNATIRAKEDGLSGIEAKVLTCVPIAEHWDVPAIHRELHRNGSALSVRSVSGVLYKLRDVGLVREWSGGRFQRIAMKPVAAVPEQSPAAPEQPAAEAAPEPVPTVIKEIDPFAAMTAAIQQVSDLTSYIESAVARLEEAALGLQEQIDRERARSEDMRQLQALLAKLRP